LNKIKYHDKSEKYTWDTMYIFGLYCTEWPNLLKKFKNQKGVAGVFFQGRISLPSFVFL